MECKAPYCSDVSLRPVPPCRLFRLPISTFPRNTVACISWLFPRAHLAAKRRRTPMPANYRGPAAPKSVFVRRHRACASFVGGHGGKSHRCCEIRPHLVRAAMYPVFCVARRVEGRAGSVWGLNLPPFRWFVKHTLPKRTAMIWWPVCMMRHRCTREQRISKLSNPEDGVVLNAFVLVCTWSPFPHG